MGQDVARPHIEMTKIKRLGIDSLRFTPAAVDSSGSIFISESVSSRDTTFFDNMLLPDENPDDFFSDKLDSLFGTWYIKNMFNSDSAKKISSDFFPTNLPDSVYIVRFKEVEQVISLSYNNIVKNFIRLYTEKRRDQVEIMLGLSAIYFPVFEETLDKYEMPLELKYLPVIESALNPMARSRAGAIGLWQIMYRTGRQLDLEITSFVDERRDPVKSTEAAVRYLKQLYDSYGDWHLVIAAYNCGPGNVNRALRRAGNKKNYWEIYYLLPRETRGFVPAFIAAHYVMNYYEEHNLIPRLPEIPLQTDTVFVHDYLHFDQISATLDIEKEHLRSLNPMYRRDVVPAKKGNPYPLTLTRSVIMEFIDKDTLVFAYEREKYFPDNTLVNPTSNTATYFTPADVEGKAKIIYTVKSGDNVGFISSWFKVRASDLRYWNNIHRNLIRVGQKLVVYVSEEEKEKYARVNSLTFAQKQAMIGKTVTLSATEQENRPLDPNYEYYTVRRGDTIWEIAKRFTGISSDEILRLNNLTHSSRISIGQKLKIRAKDNI